MSHYQIIYDFDPLLSHCTARFIQVEPVAPLLQHSFLESKVYRNSIGYDFEINQRTPVPDSSLKIVNYPKTGNERFWTTPVAEF